MGCNPDAYILPTHGFFYYHISLSSTGGYPS